MSAFSKQVERLANAAQVNPRQTQGDNNLLARILGSHIKAPPQSTGEAWGRGFREFILPMIMRGVQSWKANYDARGDFKDEGAKLLDMLVAGKELNDRQKAILDNYQNRYRKEYDEALAAAQARAQAATAPQGTLPGDQSATPQAQPAANDVNTSAMREYIQNQLPQFENPADVQTIDPGNALTGAALVEEANEKLKNLFGDPNIRVDSVLNWNRNGW